MSLTKGLVERALQESQINRDSDRHLCVRVWELQIGQPLDPSFKEWFLHSAIFPDTITRARRDFQEKGMYLASEEVDRSRFDKFREHREGYIPIP